MNEFLETLALFASKQGLMQHTNGIALAQADLDVLTAELKRLHETKESQVEIDTCQKEIRILNGVIDNLRKGQAEFEAEYNRRHAEYCQKQHRRIISANGNRSQEVFIVGGKSHTRHLQKNGGKWTGRSLIGNEFVQF